MRQSPEQTEPQQDADPGFSQTAFLLRLLSLAGFYHYSSAGDGSGNEMAIL